MNNSFGPRFERNSRSVVIPGGSAWQLRRVRYLTVAILAIQILVGADVARAEAPNETIVTPTVDSVSAFKNGVAVIRASFRVEKPGVYVWQRPPPAIHGTFWVESDLKLDVRSTARMLPAPEGVLVATPGLQQELAGHSVDVTLKATGGGPPVTLHGRVWSPPADVPIRTWDTNFATLAGAYGGWPYSYYAAAGRNIVVGTPTGLPGPGMFLILENKAGDRQYISADSIASINVDGAVKRQQPEQTAPVLMFEITDPPKEPATVQVSYLARGFAWVPSYRLDLQDEAKMKIRMGAVVRNELIDLRDAEVRLISGYPAMPYAHVDSPLWATGTLANFFAQLNNKSGGAGAAVVTQNMIASNSMPFNPGAAGGDAAEAKEENAAGVDMHFESIGHRTLSAGDSLSVDVGTAECSYERVIEWVITDKHDPSGRYRERSELKEDEDQPWDALRFANPFPFPMTTGTAMTVEHGDFRSQGTSYWLNPGQHGTLRTGKSLTLKVEATENEDETARKSVKFDGRQYWQHTMQTTLRMESFRDRAVKVIVRAQFTGDLVSAAGKPEKRNRPERQHDLNSPRELEWTVTVPEKAASELQYSYTYLTR